MNSKNLDLIASKYENIHKNWENLLRIVRNNEFDVFMKYAHNKKNVMEIGIGDGIFTSFLAKNFEEVIAVDGSLKTIQIVKEKLKNYPNIEYIRSYIEELNLDNKADNIVMSHILEHLEDPIYALKNIKKFLYEDSIVYISVPNSMSLHRQVAVKMGLLESCDSLNKTDINLGHKRVYSPETFKDHVLKAGFKIIKFGGSMIKPLTNKQIQDNWTEDMIKGFIELGNDYPELCGDIYIVAKKGD